jgi:hypothetical protein
MPDRDDGDLVPANALGRVKQISTFRSVARELGLIPAGRLDLVTLDQCAAMVNRRARTLRNYRGKGMPEPHVRGRKGQPHEYLWSEMRPWLELTFRRVIPPVEIEKYRTSKDG